MVAIIFFIIKNQVYNWNCEKKIMQCQKCEK